MQSKLVTMEEGNNKRRFLNVTGMDRMSNLPQHLIGLILERLPIQDAVRTSILSKNWRYIWTTMTLLVFDKQFSRNVERSTTFGGNGTIRIINHVLILHNGPISKFSLHIPHRDSLHEVDQTMLLISRRSVQELALTNSYGCYELPSYISYCSELRKLELEKCIFKPLLKFEAFSNLEDLHLKMIDFGVKSCGALVTLPKLRRLVLVECKNVYNFNIKASQLQALRVVSCYDAMFLWLLDAPCLNTVCLYFRNSIKVFVQVERMSVTQLLSNLPKIKKLTMDGYFLECLSADEIPKWLPRAVNSLSDLQLEMLQLTNLNELDGVLCLLRNSPNLERLYMSLRMPLQYDVKGASDHLDCLDQTLNRLQTVEIEYFDGSRPALLLIKLLLAHSPCLEKLTIHQSRTSFAAPFLSLNMIMQFPKASPKAELIFFNPKT